MDSFQRKRPASDERTLFQNRVGLKLVSSVGKGLNKMSDESVLQGKTAEVEGYCAENISYDEPEFVDLPSIIINVPDFER